MIGVVIFLLGKSRKMILWSLHTILCENCELTFRALLSGIIELTKE